MSGVFTGYPLLVPGASHAPNLSAAQYDPRNVQSTTYFEITRILVPDVPAKIDSSSIPEIRLHADLTPALRLLDYNPSTRFRKITIGLESASIRHLYDLTDPDHATNGFIEAVREPIAIKIAEFDQITNSRYFIMLPQDSIVGVYSTAQINFLGYNSCPKNLTVTIGVMDSDDPTNYQVYHPNYTRQTLKPAFNSQFIRAITVRLFVTASFEPYASMFAPPSLVKAAIQSELIDSELGGGGQQMIGGGGGSGGPTGSAGAVGGGGSKPQKQQRDEGEGAKPPAKRSRRDSVMSAMTTATEVRNEGNGSGATGGPGADKPEETSAAVDAITSGALTAEGSGTGIGTAEVDATGLTDAHDHQRPHDPREEIRPSAVPGGRSSIYVNGIYDSALTMHRRYGAALPSEYVFGDPNWEFRSR